MKTHEVKLKSGVAFLTDAITAQFHAKMGATVTQLAEEKKSEPSKNKQLKTTNKKTTNNKSNKKTKTK